MRDDREAARHRIEALEREIEEERERARRAEDRARAAAEALERRDAPRSAGSSPSAAPSTSTAAPVDPGPWAEELRRRYVRGVVAAAFALSLPALVLYAGWPRDFERDESLLAWGLLPPALLPPAAYLLARACRAPFPGSAILPIWLACGIGGVGVFVGGSDLVWGELLADPPWRWLTRGATGLIGIAAFAAAASHWSAEAVLKRIEPGD